MLEQFCNEEHVDFLVTFHDVSRANNVLTSKEVGVIDSFLGALDVRWFV